MSGPTFAKVLQSLAETQRLQLKSIVYGGANEFTKQAYEAIRDLYLSKKAPHQLQELKLLGVQVRDPGLLRCLLSDLVDGMRLRSLCLAKV